MSQVFLLASAAVLVGAAVCLLSVLQNSVAQLSPVSLRVLAERANGTSRLLADLSKDPRHFLLPVELGIQVLQVLGAVLVTAAFTLFRAPHPYLFSAIVLLVGVYLFRQLLPRLITHRNPDRVLLRILPLAGGVLSLLRWLSYPVAVVMRRAQSRRESEHEASEEEEVSDEEIQAYLDVGEEEGIIEKEESELIQSALEFGTTLVREIMTPRSEIVAAEESSTLEDLKALFVSSKHSRIPVYRQRLDEIVGVAYVRHLLALLETSEDAAPITPLLNRPWFVPETKRVAELLKEMQANAEHLAIVINEYGAVSGLVTIEDLVEEIVGDIRDEDELLKTNLTYEGNGSYIVRGALSLEELENALDLDFGEQEVSTISGLVVSSLGRVPKAGESMLMHSLDVEVLSADRRRIHTLRLRRAPTPETTGARSERGSA